MSLRLIMAVSADGYLASGLNDDMSWTGQLDKTIFKLLTSVGGVVGAGHNTFWQLPHLSGRRLVCLMDDINGCGPRYFRKGIPPSCVDLVDDWDACAPAYAPRSSTMHDVMDVVQFARLHRGAWLIGGPATACKALDLGLVSEVVMCHSAHALLGGGIVDKVTQRLKVDTTWTSSRHTVSHGPESVHVVNWNGKDRQRGRTL